MYMLVYYQFNTCSALYHYLLSQSQISLRVYVDIYVKTDQREGEGGEQKIVILQCSASPLRFSCTVHRGWTITKTEEVYAFF